MHSLELDGSVAGAPKAPDLFRSAVSTLQAKSLAIVGASERARWPSEIFKNLREFGYPGRIALINPRQSASVRRALLSVAAQLPEPVDHALVIVPGSGVPDVLLDAEAAGVKSATVYASMIGDGEDPESSSAARGSRSSSPRSRLRVAGPNCMGAYSYRERAARLSQHGIVPACAGPGRLHLPVRRPDPILDESRRRARTALLLLHHIRKRTRPRTCRLSQFRHRRSETRQVVLFIEGIRRPAAFMHAAGRALAMGKPVLAIKSGATAKSQAASQSHTGAIAGDYAAYLAMCERYGIVNCRSLDDLVETALAFDGGRLPKGPRIGFVTTSGATVDLLYDYAESEGAVMPDFARCDEGGAAADDAGRDHAAAIRSTSEFLRPCEIAAATCATAAADPDIDMVAWAAPMPRKDRRLGRCHAAARALLDKTDKPIVGVWPRDLAGDRAWYARPAGRRISVSAGHRADRSRAQCDCGFTRRAEAVRRRRRPRPSERSFAGHAGLRRSRVTASSCRKARRLETAAAAVRRPSASVFPSH